MTKRNVDIAIISDVHLGTYGCHAKELNQYLKSIQPLTLVLNGDFFDIWQFRKTYFPKDHMEVIQTIIKLSTKGTRVYYLTGNHDDALRQYTDFSAGNLHLRDKLIFEIHGKKYWVFHGDIFDVFMRFSPLLARLGGKGYDLLIRVNRLINHFRYLLGLRRLSFAGRVKSGVKKAVRFMADFEETAVELAEKQGFDFVICGHVHRPTIKSGAGKNKKVTYLNSGDWVENLTSLEYAFGKWSIYKYDETDYEFVNSKLQVDLEPVTMEAADLQEWMVQLNSTKVKLRSSNK